jgi:hypothetical protein
MTSERMPVGWRWQQALYGLPDGIDHFRLERADDHG